MKLNELVRSSIILERLQTIIQRAEASDEVAFRVTSAEVQFTAASERVAGVSTPDMWFLPKGLLEAEMSEVLTHEVSFILKRREAASALDSIEEDVALAIETVRNGLRALKQLQGAFETSAKITLTFEVSSEGKIEFIFKVGGANQHSHSLTLELHRR